MADTFFGFDTTINHGDHLLGTDELDCIETEEEEYDALNDETFGTLEDDNNLEDWEQQHEQLAEIAESSRQLENSLNQLVLDDDDFPITEKENAWSYNKGGGLGRNGEVIDNAVQKVQSLYPEIKATKQPTPIGPVTKKICTVEELERGLMTPRPQKPFQASQNFPNPQVIHHPLFPAQPIPRIPPGLHPMNLAGPPLRNIPPMGMPNSFPMMLPYPPGLGPGQMHPHRMMQHGSGPFPVTHPFNYPKNLTTPILRPGNQQQPQQRGVFPLQNQPPQQQQQQAQQPRQQINAQQQRPAKSEVVKDEYAGLMTNREKQWLLNIQLLQLNTGTPYFDDYYYTVYKSRNKNKSENKTNQENKSNYYQYQQNNNNNMNNKRGGGGNNHHNNSRERHDSTSSGSSILQARVYTPLQFENSLGKLQCGSVTAPRKIIDTDVVTLDNGQDANNSTIQTNAKDTRKTKQVLLEIEAFYALLLKMEDLRNPVAITNTEKLRELKQKQRLRELEAAQTPEQKQEVFKLLQKESVPVEENPNDYLMKLVTGLSQDDKFIAFFSVRKGKGLLLRVLPYLTQETYSSHLLDLWIKILLSIPIIGRRDAIGDNMLPKLHPFFKRYVQMCTMSDIVDIIASISETVKQDQNSRSTPLHHQGKAPLYFIIGNKLGISTVAMLVVRTEYLLSSDNVTEKQKETWFNFLITLVDLLSSAVNVAHPMDPVPLHILFKHLKRVPFLTPEQIAQLESKIADD
nr:protein PAT1 homolog 1-like [Onthophagus taurus]